MPGIAPPATGPEIQACHAAIRAEPPPVFFKQLSVYFPVVVDHAKPALDRQIVKAEYVGAAASRTARSFPLSTRRIPFKDSQRMDRFFVRNREISCKANSPVFTFSAKSLMYSAFRNVIPKDCNVSIPAAEMLCAFTSPNCALHSRHIVACAFVDIWLADDVMHHGRKQVGIHRTVNVADFFNDLTQTLVFGFQIFDSRSP